MGFITALPQMHTMYFDHIYPVTFIPLPIFLFHIFKIYCYIFLAVNSHETKYVASVFVAMAQYNNL